MSISGTSLKWQQATLEARTIEKARAMLDKALEAVRRAVAPAPRLSQFGLRFQIAHGNNRYMLDALIAGAI